ncbi:ABC transporter permease [Pontibacter rugosus]|uniref:ABC transporter permease n=1 Tax=Pontibacter rugosus TaxID=1745966 RepID=A0ABW3SP56_9BACT
MVRSIAKKEFVSTLRDKRFVALSLIVLLLLLSATVVGLHSYNTIQEERQVAQQTVNNQFANSEERHPHRMAHYGSYAFRPKSSISFLDFGIDSYTGASVFMEAHKQNSANFSQAQQSSSLIRFGEMTVAFVLQMLIPLLIIFLCFGAFTQEKETGTLKLLLSQGVTLRAVAWAKILGYSKVVILVVAPALMLASLLLFGRGSFEVGVDVIARLLLFVIFYLIYFFIFIVLSVVVSALHQRSSTALVTLLGIWMLCCVIIPKASANLGATLYTTPTKAQMDADVHEEVENGVNGHNAHDERSEALKQEILKKYGVATVEELPVNLDGILMAAGEEHSSRVYKEHFDELTEIYQKQNSISEWAGMLNPYLAVRHLSMGMAGSDFSHYVHFQNMAEQYRYDLAQGLNHIQTTRIKHGDKETRLSSDTWKEFKPFTYELPGVGWALGHHVVAITALLFWLVLVSTVGMKLIDLTKVA